MTYNVFGGTLNPAQSNPFSIPFSSALQSPNGCEFALWVLP